MEETNQETLAAEQAPADAEGMPSETEQTQPDAAESDVKRDSLTAEELLGATEQPAQDTAASELKAVLEAIVYVLNEPLTAVQIAQALGRTVQEVEPVLRELAEDTAKPNRGILIREVAGGYQMSTKAEHHEVVRNFVKNLKQPLKLSQAALETLAVIAYKQPITVPEILEIRGVQGAGVLKTLLDRKLIATAGRKNVVGKPILYKTTKDFLTQFGLKDLTELPTLKEFEELRRQAMEDDEVTSSESPHSDATAEPTGEAEPTLEAVEAAEEATQVADAAEPERSPDA